MTKAIEHPQRSITGRLIRLRYEKGLSQADISRTTGISYRNISLMERGHDAEVTLGDLGDYVAALGFELCVEIKER